ncbi:hypothetical protein OHB54_42775 [Streptomyces sp. NBC_01007]|nr:hypothetical protein OHB54_42775 [Streptomyces sp. NBC_01007]
MARAPATGVVLIKVVHGTLIHCYAARSGKNSIYLFTYKADTSVIASRCIARLKPRIFPTTYPATWSDSDSDSVIESADVFAKTGGTTRAKHFSNLRTIDYDHFGFSSSAASIRVVRSKRRRTPAAPSSADFCGTATSPAPGSTSTSATPKARRKPSASVCTARTSWPSPTGPRRPPPCPGATTLPGADALGPACWTGASGRPQLTVAPASRQRRTSAATVSSSPITASSAARVTPAVRRPASSPAAVWWRSEVRRGSRRCP